MNLFSFLRLLNQLYGSRPVDLTFIRRQGLLAVKIGQLHALRVDFLSADKCHQLSALYENAEAVAAEQAKQLISAAAGNDYWRQFKSFDVRPLASASIGQVHAARLLDGQAVVIKVVKQKFTKNFRRDIKLVKRFLRFAMWFQPRLRGVANPLGLLEAVEAMTEEELNLLNEIKGQRKLERLRRDWQDKFDLSDLGSVKIFPQLSNRQVLVSERLPGQTVAKLIAARRFSYDDLLRLFRLHGFFLFCIGTFHGDIHPGNVFYDGSKFYWVDAGHLGQASKKLRQGLFYFFDHLSADDFAGAAEWLNNMSQRPLQGELYRRFAAAFLELYRDFAGKTVSQVSLTKQMMLTIKTGVLFGMDFEQEIFDVIKSLMYMDGMVLKVKPQAILLKDMRRFIDEFKTNL